MTRSAKTTKPAKTKRTPNSAQPDSTFVLKLALYLIVGSQWLRVTNTAHGWQLPLPVGLALGLVFASHEHFRIDRRIEYAVLLVAMLMGFWAQAGLYYSF